MTREVHLKEQHSIWSFHSWQDPILWLYHPMFPQLQDFYNNYSMYLVLIIGILDIRIWQVHTREFFCPTTLHTCLAMFTPTHLVFVVFFAIFNIITNFSAHLNEVQKGLYTSLAHLNDCLAHQRSRQKLPYSAVWDISLLLPHKEWNQLFLGRVKKHALNKAHWSSKC